MFFRKAPRVSYELAAPLKGEVISLSEVPDQTFSLGILGDGVAINPREGCVYAPADGTVEVMFQTGHAVSLCTEGGVEVLIHVGMDTVQLNGVHFTPHCRSGERVKKGQLLLTFDEAEIKKAGYSTTTPVVVTNASAFEALQVGRAKHVNPGDPLITLMALS